MGLIVISRKTRKLSLLEALDGMVFPFGGKDILWDLEKFKIQVYRVHLPHLEGFLSWATLQST